MQASQKGMIGITLVSHWFEPFSSNKFDKKAARRAVDFMFGWSVLNYIYIGILIFDLSKKKIWNLNCFPNKYIELVYYAIIR